MPVKMQTLVQAGFDGMQDSLDPQMGSARKAKLLQNVYPLDAEYGGGCTSRPGFILSANTTLGVTGHRIFQRFFQFTKLDGTEYTIAFAGAQMYTYNWSSPAWTQVTLAASVGLTSDVAIYCVNYNNTLVVNPNDGVNKPWSWDGTTFTSLTSAPLMYGPLTVYYARLFGVKWASRNTIDWSEVNSANTGYENGGFLNTWTLTQTDPNFITAIRGTNEALYYWRARSMGRILGAVTASFSSDGTHDAVSLKTGTSSPNAITDYGTDIFFLDSDGRPWVMTSGASPQPFWQGYRNTLLNVPRSTLVNALAVSFTPIPLVLLAVTETGQTVNNLVLTIKPQPNPQEAGIWRGWTLSAMDMVKNGSGVPTLMIGGTDGYAYIVGDPLFGTTWDDNFQSGTVAIQHVVQGSYIGFDTKLNKYFDRMRVLLKAYNTMTNVVLDFQTPDVTATLTPQTATGGALAYWDQATWDTSAWSIPGLEVPLEWGTNGYGRWALNRVTHATVGERFGLNAMEVDAFEAGVDALTV